LAAGKNVYILLLGDQGFGDRGRKVAHHFIDQPPVVGESRRMVIVKFAIVAVGLVLTFFIGKRASHWVKRKRLLAIPF
jgi:hypothetical protein